MVFCGTLTSNKMKKKRDPTVSTVLKFNRKIIEKGKIDTPTTYLHDQSLSWLGTDTSIKSDKVKLVLLFQNSPLGEMIQSCKRFLHVFLLLLYGQCYTSL
jgi:hypothetical protein